VSSAILFAAIVAIWAGALVPRWVRRSHAAREPDGVSVADALTDAEGESGESPGEPGADPATGEGWGHASAQGDPDPATAALIGDGLDLEGADSLGDGLDLAGADEGDGGLNRPRVDLAAAAAERAHWPEAPEDGLPGSAIAGHGDGTIGPERTVRAWSSHRPHAPGAASTPPGAAAGQPAVIRTRRRLLTLLALLTGGLAASAALGVGRWWMVAPAAVLLVGYLMLLREAGRADAEAAQFRALARAEDAAARRAREAAVARAMEDQERLAAAQQTAEIIDISARVSDQLYDQYADVAERAVGD